jgi:hypothetical protein
MRLREEWKRFAAGSRRFVVRPAGESAGARVVEAGGCRTRSACTEASGLRSERTGKRLVAPVVGSTALPLPAVGRRTPSFLELPILSGDRLSFVSGEVWVGPSSLFWSPC